MEEIFDKEERDRDNRDMMIDVIIEGGEITDEIKEMARKLPSRYLFLPRKVHMHKIICLISGYVCPISKQVTDKTKKG